MLISSASMSMFDLVFGTAVSRAFWNGCCWNVGNAACWLMLLLVVGKNVFVDVWDGGVASEKRSSVNNCGWWTVDCWPLDAAACWEKKSVPPKPFPLAEAVVVVWGKPVGDDDSLLLKSIEFI